VVNGAGLAPKFYDCIGVNPTPRLKLDPKFGLTEPFVSSCTGVVNSGWSDNRPPEPEPLFKYAILLFYKY